ncbi:MAG: hypothetical protein AAFO94_15765, partial [Bacteroidota bacterium]
MTYIEKIRNWLYQRNLAKAKAQRQKVDHHSLDFDKAKSFGVLFDATNIESREIVDRYVELLKRSGKSVSLLGFLNEKEMQPNFPFKHFSKKEIDFSYRPKSPDANAFMDQSFDVLLNLYLKPTLTLEYIAALSKATFRVGPVSNNTDCYDLMVQTDQQKDLRHFIQQV